MKKLIYISTYALFALYLAACSTMGATVTTDYDFDYAFASLKTFGWIDNPDVATRDPLSEKTFRSAMESQLSSKGFSLNQADPDFKIAYHGLDVQRKFDVVGGGYGYGYGRMGSRVDVYEYEEGSIIFDFIDAKTNELIYRSKVIGEIDNTSSAEDRRERTQKIVQKILADFPPKKK